MAYSLSLACHGVRHHSSGEMFASLSRDEHGAGTANIHAGSALLATGGICMLGELGCYRKDKLDAIQSGSVQIMTFTVIYYSNVQIMTFTVIFTVLSLCDVFSVLESRTVSLFIPGKKYGEDADQQLSLPVECSFWALTELSRWSGRADSAILGIAVSPAI